MDTTTTDELLTEAHTLHTQARQAGHDVEFVCNPHTFNKIISDRTATRTHAANPEHKTLFGRNVDLNPSMPEGHIHARKRIAGKNG